MSELLASWRDEYGQNSLVRITAPSVEPVSIAECKTHTKIDIIDDDGLIDTYRKAARRNFERWTGRCVHQSTLEYIRDNFPNGDYIKLPRATPLITVTSIKYKDSAGTETTWTSSEYIADTDSLPGRIVLAYGQSWPSFTPYPSNPIRIRYTAGVATTSPVTEADEDIKIPLFLLVAHQYQNREALTDRANLKMLPLGLRSLIEDLTVEYVF